MKVNFTVCCDEELALMIKEKNLSPSDCFKLGIKTSLNQPFTLEKGVSIDNESWKAKAESIARTMQNCIDGLNEKIDKLEQSKINNGK
jgi:hypothetical protein